MLGVLAALLAWRGVRLLGRLALAGVLLGLAAMLLHGGFDHLLHSHWLGSEASTLRHQISQHLGPHPVASGSAVHSPAQSPP